MCWNLQRKIINKKKVIYYSKILGLKKGRKLKGSYNINFGKEINTSNDFNYNRIEIYFY